jgi:subtilisin family serine protease
MVAGIVALVAPDARILPVRVLDDEGRGDAFTIDKGVHHALSRGADVLNMSFGGPQGITSLHYQIQDAWQAGVPVVAGAGNEGRSSPKYFPASDSRAYMVTALDSLDVKADFADYSSDVLVSAPGTGVRSAYPGGEWGAGSGCSFATPFVTGEVALVRSLEPGLGPDEIEARVAAAVQPIDQNPGNAPYRGKLGTGRIYLPLAVAGAGPGAVVGSATGFGAGARRALGPCVVAAPAR